MARVSHVGEKPSEDQGEVGETVTANGSKGPRKRPSVNGSQNHDAKRPAISASEANGADNVLRKERFRRTRPSRSSEERDAMFAAADTMAGVIGTASFTTPGLNDGAMQAPLGASTVARSADDTEKRKKRKTKKEKAKRESRSFLNKTFEIFSTPKFNHCATWSESGRNIIITDVFKFASEVLPKYFKHGNFSSFVRQLNMYGFAKSGHDSSKNVFMHEFFQRGRPDLLSKIKRKRTGMKMMKKKAEVNDTNASSSSSPSSSLVQSQRSKPLSAPHLTIADKHSATNVSSENDNASLADLQRQVRRLSTCVDELAKEKFAAKRECQDLRKSVAKFEQRLDKILTFMHTHFAKAPPGMLIGPDAAARPAIVPLYRQQQPLKVEAVDELQTATPATMDSISGVSISTLPESPQMSALSDSPPPSSLDVNLLLTRDDSLLSVSDLPMLPRDGSGGSALEELIELRV